MLFSLGRSGALISAFHTQRPVEEKKVRSRQRVGNGKLVVEQRRQARTPDGNGERNPLNKRSPRAAAEQKTR